MISVAVFVVGGFFSSYLLTLAGAVLFISFVILIILGRSKSLVKITYIFTFFCCSIILFHLGLLVRNSLRSVCFNSTPINSTENKVNIKPLSLPAIEQEIALYNNLFSTEILHKIVYENNEYNIKKIASTNKANNLPRILIISGMHGLEPAGVYAVPEILRIIKTQNLLEKFNIEIIYALNPVGLSLFYRFNECNCDINRDFITFKTTQSNLIKNLLNSVKYDYVLDLHEGSYDGHYFINNTSFTEFDEIIENEFEDNNIDVSPLLKNKLKDFLFQYELDNPLTKYNQIMTMDNYLNSLGVENILSESNGLSNNMDKRVLGHVLVFEKLIKCIERKSISALK